MIALGQTDLFRLSFFCKIQKKGLTRVHYYGSMNMQLHYDSSIERRVLHGKQTL